VFNYRQVDLLMRKWDWRWAQLERAEHNLKKTGNRPVMKPGGCCSRGEQVGEGGGRG
jgi:hypothetical protein